MSRGSGSRGVTVEVACGGAVHRPVVHGTEMHLPDHEDTGELLLEALGGPRTAACLEVRDAWRAGRFDGLPRALHPLVIERWERGGIAAGAVAEFAAALRVPVKVDPPGRNGSFSPAVDAARWFAALGRVPTPEDLAALRAVGVVDSSQATAWTEALGRPLRPTDVVRHRGAGILDGHDAQLWRRALGELPTGPQLARWRGVDVHNGWDAMCWAQLTDAAPTVDAVRALQERGVVEPPATWAARHR